MTTQALRQRITPFLEDWAERGLESWQQFRNWSVQQILWDANLSMDEIEEVTKIDGAGDEGIDGWYVDEAASPTRLILVQSKDTEVAREDLSKMKDGLVKLLSSTYPVSANRALLEKTNLFKHSLPTEFEVDLYLTSSRIAPSSLTPNQDGNANFSEQVYLEQIGRLVSVYSYVRDIRFLVENIQVMHEDPISASFSVERGSFFEFKVGGHTKTVTAALKATDLAALYQREKQNLFRRNPRYYLGPSVPRNAEIKRTILETDNEGFFIYNNGLTCVAREIRVDPDMSDPNLMHLSVKDFQVVNGCQTTATLADPTLGPRLAKVRVLAKIVENHFAGSVESDATSDRIATYSNSQNPLKAEDWKANDPRQKVWHVEFDRGVPERWFYEIKRGTWATIFAGTAARAPYKDTVTGKFRKMTMKDLGQECWAFLGHPAEAKDKAREIFNKVQTYDLVFREGLTAAELLLPHIIYEAADAKTKGNNTYALPTNDPERERFPEAQVPTEHLRHPIVAAVGRVLARLKSAQIDYLTREESLHLIGHRAEWLGTVVDMAFEELGRALLLDAARKGIGARSVVRSNDWMTDALHSLSQRVSDRVATERSLGSPAGSLAMVLPHTFA